MPTGLKVYIQDLAARLGFTAVGISRARPVSPNAIVAWLESGYHGQMLYMEKSVEKRLDPEIVLPGVRSIVSVAINYLHAVEMPYSDRRQGVFSRYARGLDYHWVLERKLNQLLDGITSVEPRAFGKVYVDTGPVMDKFWAVESGVGWLGKHSNVLSRKDGSWFFLGELLLNVELEPDSPMQDFCGSCTRCIDACPTGAIVEPYVVDGRKCLSYTTIELRNDIPENLLDATGNLVFGCDICQDVCPWNRKAAESQFEGFRDPGRDYSLKGLARMTPEQFSQVFSRSAVKRTKWRGLMRNVAVAMGNSRAGDMVPELSNLLLSEDSMIRRHAAWSLKKIEESCL